MIGLIIGIGIVIILSLSWFFYREQFKKVLGVAGAVGGATLLIMGGGLIDAQAGESWIIDGNSVYMNTSKAFIQITPHTLTEDNDVTLELLSKTYTGDITVAFEFDNDVMLPSNARVWNVSSQNVSMQRTCDTTNGTYFYNASGGIAYCWLAANNSLEWSQAYDSFNVSSDTIYWSEEVDTSSFIPSGATPDNVVIDGNKIYYFSNVAVTAGIPRKFQFHLNIIGGSGKYNVSFWPSSYGGNRTAAELDGNYYVLDPWWQSTASSTKTIDSSQSLNNGLLVAYNFEETSGDLIDEFGNSDQSFTGTQTYGIDSPQGKAINYTTIGTYSAKVDATGSNLPSGTTSNLTVSIWVKGADMSGADRFWAVGGYSGCPAQHTGCASTGAIYLGGTGTYLLSGYTFSDWTTDIDISALGLDDDEWHNLVLTRNASILKVYVDGVLEDVDTSRSGDICGNGQEEIVVNAHSCYTTLTTSGYPGMSYDMYYIWNRSLTDGGVSEGATATGEIATLYASGLAKLLPQYDVEEFRYAVNITINSSEVDADLTDFPVYVNMSAVDFTWTGFEQSDCGDLRVTNSSGSELPREVVACNITAETGELHFKADSISSSTDTVFTIHYGSQTATDYAVTDTYGAQNVWTDYIGVWHLEDLNDSTDGDHDLTNSGAVQVTDILGKAYDFELSDSTDVLSTSCSTECSFTAGGGDDLPYTQYAWVELESLSANMIPWAKFQAGSANTDYQPLIRSTGQVMIANDDGAGNDQVGRETDTGAFVSGGRYHLAYTYNGNNAVTGFDVIIDGVVSDTTDWTYGAAYDGMPGSSEVFRIGNRYTATAPVPWDGIIDEVRLSGTNFTTEYLNATYKNQKGGSTFLSSGATVDFLPTVFGYAINVTVNSSEVDDDLADFPVYVNMSAVNFNWSHFQQADCGDLRITNTAGDELPREIVSCRNQLPYWIDPSYLDEFWFKADLVQGNNTFYLKKGGDAVPNGEDTFLWYDNASTDRLSEYSIATGGKASFDTDKYSWTQRNTYVMYPTGVTAQNVSVRMDFAQTTDGSVDNRQFYWRARMNSGHTVYSSLITLWRQSALGTDEIRFYDTTDGNINITNVGWSYTGDWYRGEYMIDGLNMISFINRTQNITGSLTTMHPSNYIGFGTYVYDGKLSARNLIIREYTYGENNVTITDNGDGYIITVTAPKDLNNYSVLVNGTELGVVSSTESWVVRDNASVGELYFKADSISSSSDTNFTIYYGSASDADYATDAPNGAGNVWSDYAGVYHLDIDGRDSTNNGNDGTDVGTVEHLQAIIEEGINLSGSEDYISIATDTSLDLSVNDQFLIQGWYYYDSDPALRTTPMQRGLDTTEQFQMMIQQDTATPANEAIRCFAGMSDATRLGASDFDNYGSTLNEWHMFHCQWDGDYLRLFHNGSYKINDSTGVGKTLKTDTSAVWLGNSNLASRDMDGLMDEMRIRYYSVSDEWLAAEFSNQKQGSVFLSSGAEVDLNDTGVTVTIGSYNITSPTNTTYNMSTISFNWTANITVDYCAYVLDGGAANTSICDPSTTNVTFDVSDGAHNVYITGNFSANGTLVNSSTVYFTVDTEVVTIAFCSGITDIYFLGDVRNYNFSTNTITDYNISALNQSTCLFNVTSSTSGIHNYTAATNTTTTAVQRIYCGQSLATKIELNTTPVRVLTNVDNATLSCWSDWIGVGAGDYKDINITVAQE